LKEAVETISAAVGAGVMSKKTAIEYIAMNSDTEEELNLIKADGSVKEVPPRTA